MSTGAVLVGFDPHQICHETKRFLDTELPDITAAMLVSSPTAPTGQLTRMAAVMSGSSASRNRLIAETFVACSCPKLGRHCEICSAAAWNGCAGGKLCGSLTTNSFLLFARGACKAPRPLSGIADLIPAQLSEIKNYEIGKRGNFHNPLKPQQMLARKGALCQWLILKYHVFFGMSIWTNSNRQITRPWRDIWWLKSTGWK